MLIINNVNSITALAETDAFACSDDICDSWKVSMRQAFEFVIYIAMPSHCAPGAMAGDPLAAAC